MKHHGISAQPQVFIKVGDGGALFLVVSFLLATPFDLGHLHTPLLIFALPRLGDEVQAVASQWHWASYGSQIQV